jgi:oligopeptidase B
MLDELLLFADHVVLFEREDGLPQVRALDLETGQDHRVTFPEPVYSVWSGENRVFGTSTLRFVYESLVSPAAVFDYDMRTRERQLVKRQPVPNYDASRYESERILATARDGARVPVSIVRHKGTPRDGSAPLLLYGYGAYGISIDAYFSSVRLSLLDRGVSFAIAHIRGGGEMGKPWHDQGRMLAKRNTFTDFIAAAEALIAGGHTSPARMAIEGRSAGGLLIGAVLNMRPELFRAAHLGVPFVDVVNTMLDETLPLTVGEFEEWGNPAKPEEYAVIKTYCPYTNLAPRDYPAILVTTSLNDSQVMYWEPAKYVARLRALNPDGRPPLFKINMAAGHGGASGRYDHLHEAAFEYAFLLRELGVVG